MKPASGGEAGYAVLARVLSAFYAIDPPLDARQVYAWAERRTENKKGVPWPDPVREIEHPKRGQPRYLFSVRAALEWYAAGVPDLYGKGWREQGNESAQ
jgi:hypothetical protein